MPNGIYTVWDVIGGGGTENHGIGDKIQRDNKTADTMTRIQGVSHSGVYDGASKADERDGDSN